MQRAAARRRAIDRLLDPTLFKALGDPTRAAILACLAKCGRAVPVGDIAGCCAVDLSVVSRHLAQLASAGLLASERRGRSVQYRVRYAEVAAALRAIADAVAECCPEDADCCRIHDPCQTARATAGRDRSSGPRTSRRRALINRTSTWSKPC